MADLTLPFSTLWSSGMTCADTIKRLTEDPAIVLEEVNVHVTTFALDYGPVYNVAAYAPANSIITMPKTRACDWWFKNHVAGQNAVVVMVGSLKGSVG